MKCTVVGTSKIQENTSYAVLLHLEFLGRFWLSSLEKCMKMNMNIVALQLYDETDYCDKFSFIFCKENIVIVSTEEAC